MHLPPRIKNAAVTRENILVAARLRFLQESYENVGLRDIAGDARVDVALVSRYFGSKEELFREVLRGGRCEWLDPAIGAADLPGWLADVAMREQGLGEREDLERLLIILRSASSPCPAQVVRESFGENVLEPMAALIGGPDAHVKASLALSLLMGTTILRTIMSVEPLCECDPEAVRAKMTRLFADALS